MTGKELIMYILTNDLEYEPIFNHGRFIGHMTVDEVALKLDIGIAAVCALIAQGQLDYIRIGDTFFIPDNNKLERKINHE